MERVQVLIDKLSTQKAANQLPAQMLITVQLLNQELLKIIEPTQTGISKKVAVIMPAIYPVRDHLQEPLPVGNRIVEKELSETSTQPLALKEEKHLFQQQSFFDTTQTETKTTSTEPLIKETYVLNMPPASISEPVNEEVKQPSSTSMPFDVLSETPTLSYRQPQQKEIHETIGASEASLNDKLKEEKIEVVHILKDAPIKDLRKGIGVNDRFLFINELFRGDESLYEKSIKTINAFHILPEAEYWINRELKLRLAWNDNKEVVQHFYQLVRRRFS